MSRSRAERISKRTTSARVAFGATGSSFNRGVDQLADHEAHNLAVAGSSPAPATKFLASDGVPRERECGASRALTTFPGSAIAALRSATTYQTNTSCWVADASANSQARTLLAEAPT